MAGSGAIARSVGRGRQALLSTTALCTAALIAGAALTSPVSAAQKFWDGTDTTADADGGDGTWDQGVTNNWDTAATAGANAVWNANDDANFGGAAGTVTVSGTVDIASVTFTTGGYSLTGGTINGTAAPTVIVNNGGSGVSIASQISGGAFNFGGASLVTISNATNNFTGTLTSSGLLTATATGALGSVAGTLLVTNGTLDLGGVAHTKGTLSQSGGTIQNGTLTVATFTQTAGTLGATGTITSAGAQSLQGGSIAGTLNGAGAVTVTTGVTTVTGSISGTSGVGITSGTLSISGAGSVTAPIVNGATLELASGGDVTGTIANNAIMNVNGGAGTSTVTGLITNNGTLNVAAASTLAANGDITNTAALNNLTGGTITGNIATTGGTFANDGAVTGTVAASATFNNTANGTVSGLTTITAGTTTNAGQLNGGVSVSGTGVLTTTGTVNNGITNGNIVNADGGTINGTVTNNATFNVGGTVSGTGTFNNALAGSRLLVNTGSYTLTGAISNSGTNVAGGILVAAGASLSATGITNNAGATIVNNGTITDDLDNAGTVINNGGATYNATVNTNTGTITNDAGGIWNGNVTSNAATIVNLGTWNTVGGGTINNDAAGTINSSGGASIINGNVANSGQLFINNQLNGNLTNNATGSTFLGGPVTGIGVLTNNGTLQMQGASLAVGSLTGTNAAALINNGGGAPVTLTVGSDNTTSSYAGAITNTGAALSLTKIGTGTLTLSGTNTFTGPATITGGVLAVSGGNAIGNGTAVNIGAAGTLQVLSSETVGAVSNAGIINMQNGATAETLTTATYAGGGQLRVDVNLGPGGGTADKLVVTGAGGTSGVTTVNFANTGGTVALNPDILVVDTNGVAAGTDFQAANLPPPVGLVQVSFQRKGDDWFVVSTPNVAATGGVIGNITVVQSTLGAIVNRPSSPFVSGLAAEVEPNHCGPGVWMRETGGMVNASSTTTSSLAPSAVSNVSLSYAGAQFGMDMACFNIKESGIDVSTGLIGGYNGGVASQVVPNAGVTNSQFSQGYGGAYVTFAKGAFSADLQARADFTNFVFNNPAIQLVNTPINTVRGTVSGSASYAFQMNDMAVVPTVGFSASQTTSSVLTFTSGQQLISAPSQSLIGFVGGTVAKTIVLPDEVSAAQPFATATVYNDFAAFPSATFFDPSTGQSQVLTSSHLGTIGEISLGANFFHVFEAQEGKPRQVNATIRLDVRFNSVLLGAGLTGQVRAQF